MSVILEDVLDEELNEKQGYSKYDYRTIAVCVVFTFQTDANKYI